MAFEDQDTDELGDEYEEGPPPEETGNRSFLIIAGIMGAIAILALICIAIYALVLRPSQIARRDQQAATLNAQNTEVAKAITQTSAASKATFTPTVTPIPNTPTPSQTAVVVVPTNTSVPTEDPRTATVAALLTQAAKVTQTQIPTATALPTTGFADQVGLPAMLGIAVVLIVVFFLARRLRTV